MTAKKKPETKKKPLKRKSKTRARAEVAITEVEGIDVRNLFRKRFVDALCKEYPGDKSIGIFFVVGNDKDTRFHMVLSPPEEVSEIRKVDIISFNPPRDRELKKFIKLVESMA